jgi:hypothetical protein
MEITMTATTGATPMEPLGPLNLGSPQQQDLFDAVRDTLLAISAAYSARAEALIDSEPAAAEQLYSERREYMRLLKQITPTDERLPQLAEELSQRLAEIRSL